MFLFAEMLTPVDQPLDKLADLAPDEMYGPSVLAFLLSYWQLVDLVTTWKVVLNTHWLYFVLNGVCAGWIDHFSNKYVICGKLVENDAA
jgi:membrane-associated progesterone receptor component